MVGCWKRSEEEARRTDGAPKKSHFLHKGLWISLLAFLLLVTFALGLSWYHWMSEARSQSLQIVRITAPDQTGVPSNQSAVVDQLNNLVTFLVTSPPNQTSTVLFDMKNGLVCYKPASQDACLLRTMEQSDYDNVNSIIHQSSTHEQRHFQLPGNETQRQMEFLRVLAATQVNVSSLEPIQALCQDRPVYWTQRDDGPGRQRLVYFCIDICFPSNICVSVCFYYLPE